METQEEIQTQEQETPPEPKQVAPEVIERAKTMGWIPEEQFKGDKTKWRPADEYVERAENLMPILKSQLGKYEGEIRTLKSTVESQKKTTERLLKMSEETQKRAYEQAKRDLTLKQAEAVEAGDTQKWMQLKEEEDKLQKPEPIPVEETPQTSPVFDTWKMNNQWYQTDPDLSLFADSYGRQLKETNPNMTYEQLLSAAEQKVKEVFPHKFENPARNQPSTVDGGSQRETNVKPSGKTFNDLSADERQICDNDIKNGLYKSREEWVKVFFEEE